MIYKFFKRISDIFLCSIALIVLLPVLFFAAIGVYVSSPGPIIYKANRIGQNGKPFVMYKFRSMHLNNEKGHMITLRNDNRIFPFGRFLRKTKIDELPQIINILQGSMSIVGWRPEDEENVKKVFVGKYMEILKSKPGLTSPGSLFDYTHGENYENESEYEKEFLSKKMDLELYYVKRKSLFYDARLILRTIKVILQVLFGKENFDVPEELEKT